MRKEWREGECVWSETNGTRFTDRKDEEEVERATECEYGQERRGVGASVKE